MQVKGVVVARKADRVLVRVERQSGGCGRCNEPGGCGGDRIAHLFGSPSGEYWLMDRSDVGTGTAVTLEADAGVLLRAAALAYGLPLLTTLLGASLGGWLASGGEWPAVLGAVLGLLIGYGVVRWSGVARRGMELRVRAAGQGDGGSCGRFS